MLVSLNRNVYFESNSKELQNDELKQVIYSVHIVYIHFIYKIYTATRRHLQFIIHYYFQTVEAVIWDQ